MYALSNGRIMQKNNGRSYALLRYSYVWSTLHVLAYNKCKHV
jgi:hypothetical protein